VIAMSFMRHSRQHSVLGFMPLVTGATFIAASLSAALLTLLPSSSAIAEEQGLLEELVVTARKREQNLQDVAVGVSLLSSKAMIDAQIRSADELASLIPTLNVQASSGASTSSFNIRGIGTQAFSPGVEPSVLTMLDGVTLGRSGMAFIDMVDIERIEVLRGPQGTLYGKNASGGVIHIITQDPTPEFSGSVRAIAIEDDEYRFGGTVAGPLTDTLSVRLSGSAIDDDGFAKNVVDGENINNSESYTVRGKFLWQPREDLELMWASDYSETDCDCTALSIRSVMESPSQDALLQELQPLNIGDENQDVSNDQPTFSEIDASGHSLTVNWEADAFIVTSITAYRDWDHISIVDLDNRPTNPIGLDFIIPPETNQEQFSQELRFSSVNASWGSWVIGAFYFEQDVETGNTTAAGPLAPIIPATTRVSSTEVSGENIALFGEVSYDITDKWQGTVGVRYTQEDLEYHTLDIGTDNLVFGPDGESRDTLSDSDISPKLALKWQAAEKVMVYASYVSGYKGPAFDTSLVSRDTFVQPETSDAFELGMKSSWFDNNLILNIAAFYAEYTDFQAQAFIDTDTQDQLPGNFLLVNAGQVTTQGVEIEFISRLSDNWNLTGGLAYTDGTIDEYEAGNCSNGQKFRMECPPEGFQDLSGGDLPYTPQWKLNLSTNYTVPLDQIPANLVFGADLRYQDDTLYEISQDPFSVQEAFTIVDVRATLAGTEQRYRVTAFVKNLFDENYASLIFAHGNEVLPHGYLHRVPKYANRTAGIELAYAF
jgi:iron complex outermembrane receptor protein